MKILSYNILAKSYAQQKFFPKVDSDFLKWENRKQYLVNDILKHDSDILLFQEMEGGEMYDFLREELANAGYESHFLERAKDGKNDGVATFYRRDKLSSIPPEEVKLKECHGKIQGRVALISRFKTHDGASINTINIHLEWVPKDKQKTETEYDGYDQMKSLLERSDVDIKNGNWIVCGDFNANPESSVYKLCIEKGLIDAFAANSYNTCNTNENPKRIDFCFLSPSIKKYIPYAMEGLGKEDIVPREEIPSDHLPLNVMVDVTVEQHKQRQLEL
ncbi:endonuclease/exonuclease/phosphatase family protein [Wolbachia endosymbiont of Tribolium confusum]|uniref:endonuclease/exonuclease/phosphatase family protein n=1 Tax=Wolbachia endosymbiont of Tribolium confusum TaxID=214474 RepID=UPI001CF1FA40|nr:endonuclease/exonuclease/phosphatase family protein [Wolbachia endosymbiont of Tribolium confusum]MCA7010597.1 endonuclease/exonuclease/phosphatase family protein [Wolbachia endosymbiont of Tribolium confusum]